MTDEVNLRGILEGILYVYGEPISAERLADITSCAVAEIQRALGLLEENLELEHRGIRLRCYEESIAWKPFRRLRHILRNSWNLRHDRSANLPWKFFPSLPINSL